MTEDELQAIERRCASAAAAPWRAWIEGRDHESGSSFVRTGEADTAPNSSIDFSGATDADLEFIANARQDIPRLISEVRRLRAMSGE